MREIFKESVLVIIGFFKTLVHVLLSVDQSFYCYVSGSLYVTAAGNFTV